MREPVTETAAKIIGTALGGRFVAEGIIDSLLEGIATALQRAENAVENWKEVAQTLVEDHKAELARLAQERDHWKQQAIDVAILQNEIRLRDERMAALEQEAGRLRKAIAKATECKQNHFIFHSCVCLHILRSAAAGASEGER